MSDDDYLNNIIFNFDSKKDIPELFVKTISIQAETIALRQFIMNNFTETLGISDEKIAGEIDRLTNAAKKELYAQLAVERGE